MNRHPHHRPAVSRTGLVWVLCLCAWTVPVFVAAPQPVLAATKADLRKAEQLNAQGREAFKAGRFDEAADLFMQVYDLARMPTAVFNAARARESAGKLVEAKALFELYLRIEKNPEGVQDGAKRLADIEARLKAEADRVAEAARKADADRKAEAERLRLEGERLRLAQQRAEAEKAEREREEKARRELSGVVFLPPDGLRSEASVRAVQTVLAAALEQARTAQPGPVRPVPAFLEAELGRGETGNCDFHCRLAVARQMGAAVAVATAVRFEEDQWRLRMVLWRAADATDAGQIEVASATFEGLTARGQTACGALFNGIRRLVWYPLPTAEPGFSPSVSTTSADPGTAAPPPQVQIETRPSGAEILLDGAVVGRSPLNLLLSSGERRLEARRDGYHALGGTLPVPRTGTARLVLALTAQPAPDPEPAAPVVRPGTPAVPAGGSAAVAPGATPPPAGKPPQDAGSGRTGTAGTPERRGAVATPATPVVPAQGPTDSSSEAKFGAVASLEGAIGIMEDSDGTVMPDVSGGGGGFLHLGWGPRDGLAWVSLASGVRWFSYQGLTAPSTGKASAPEGLSYWTGVSAPRLAGLLASIHMNDVSPQNGASGFRYWSWQLRLVSARDFVYVAMGVEGLISSERDQDKFTSQWDEFGHGPDWRLGIEVGMHLGASLSQ